MSMTASSASEAHALGRRLVRWPPVVDDIGAFAAPTDTQPAIRPAIVTRAKQALLDDVRTLILRGVEPRLDGLHRGPTAASLAIAEQLISSLPEDVAMPSVSLPDDGEITFAWQAMDEAGERLRIVLAVAPDCEVECFVRRRTDRQPAAHFRTKDGADLFGLPENIVSALRDYWQTA